LSELSALLDPAARARRIAADAVEFFRPTVFEHHAEEERELFPAVLASAAQGSERDRVQALVDRLTAEHRNVEAIWKVIEPEIKAVAKGRDTRLDSRELVHLVKTYVEHARFEEAEFLPLSQTILGRNQNHMAALGVALHIRHVMPSVLAKVRGRI
jgi:hemerythrin-like domain-containing protein